jgi:D-alanine-D-alanine ligase
MAGGMEELLLPQIEGVPPPADVRALVICGGGSAEAEVSRMSGRMVAEALQRTFPHVVCREPDLQLFDAIRQADVVFPVLHGPLGEDGSVQGMLEVAGVPYVGCGVLASACALDKVMAKRVFRDLGLPVARDTTVDSVGDDDEAVRQIRDRVGERVVVKPAREGSAVGVVFADGEAEIRTALRAAARYGRSLLVEERLDGAEITVGVLDLDVPRAFPVIEVRTPPGSWYDYQHRYTPGLSEHVIPAPLPQDAYAEVQRMAVEVHRGLGCRDLSRADFIVTGDGRTFLLEVNTLPGMTPTSLYPDGARAAGIEFDELVAYLVRRALARAGMSRLKAESVVS